jgi:hypothetical protein
MRVIVTRCEPATAAKKEIVWAVVGDIAGEENG